ncbi:MAG: hypothetical protein KDB01_27380, partial [Planctomycetaceae bacterium]|nr:hypothetical protein [Planctomycetaceae bacterium]
KCFTKMLHSVALQGAHVIRPRGVQEHSLAYNFRFFTQFPHDNARSDGCKGQSPLLTLHRLKFPRMFQTAAAMLAERG